MWSLTQCAVQGRSHIKNNVPCQDKTHTLTENGVSVIALADGAGSAPLSHYGAERVPELICKTFANQFDEIFAKQDGTAVKQDLVNAVVDSLLVLSVEHACDVKDLACTLLAVAVKDERFLLLHVGDGVIGYLKKETVKVASAPTNGEFANTTVFVTSKDAAKTMNLLKGNLNGIEGFVLMSDGSEASLYSKRENKLAQSLQRILRLSAITPTEHMEKLLLASFESKVRQATNDDCSIAMMAKDLFGAKGFSSLDLKKQASLLALSQRAKCEHIRRYALVLSYLKSPRTVEQISRKIHLKPQYTKRYLLRLLQLNFIETDGVRYVTTIRA